MTMLMTNATADYDGSGSPTIVAGPMVVTLSGSNAAHPPTLTMYSRSESSPFVAIHQMKGFGRFRVNLAADDECYFTVTNVKPTGSVYLSIVDV